MKCDFCGLDTGDPPDPAPAIRLLRQKRFSIVDTESKDLSVFGIEIEAGAANFQIWDQRAGQHRTVCGSCLYERLVSVGLPTPDFKFFTHEPKNG